MNDTMNQAAPMQAEEVALPVGKTRLKEFTRQLQIYKGARAKTEARIISAENWWKLRNSMEEEDVIGKPEGFVSSSAWLHNVITSKHADAVEAQPEPIVLPREEGDKDEADVLTSILPVILAQNNFDAIYDSVQWSKLKYGTAVYKVVWDQSKLHGLGDVHIARCNLLDIYWEPGITDINRSRYLFHTELVDKDLLEEQYPHLAGVLKCNTMTSAKFLYDDSVSTEKKCTVIDVYYRRVRNGSSVLHYCKYVGDEVLFATENEPEYAETGLYEHGEYPYVFDTLYPIEGSPCGYGYVDICKNPQCVIDLLKTSMVKNAMVGALPRFLSSNQATTINEKEFLDLKNPIIHVEGSLTDVQFRPVDHRPLDSSCAALVDATIGEMRETSGNTETSTGTANSGVTAASAIAALQEASGKGSRDSIATSYRAFASVMNLVIELMRQFYDAPRHYRILGDGGMQKYISYTNKNLKPRPQGDAFGVDLGYYKPCFDVDVVAHKKSAYSRVAQNELALQLYDKGLLNPMMVDQALLTIEMMDFDGKDELMQKLANNATMLQKLMTYLPIVMEYAAGVGDAMLLQMATQDYAMYTGGQPQPAAGGAGGALTDPGAGEHGTVTKAREQARNASQPT